ncbi:MAG: prolyl oligopeptidase family serine peptidase [Bacillota bacterium]|nr:prolyl oligopeptidase family serine peptidase [Bacillota bacterium]
MGAADGADGTADIVDVVDVVRFYSYDRTAPLSAHLTLKEENPWYRRYELTYMSEGDMVYAAYFEPRTAAAPAAADPGDGRVPAVIGVHGMFSEAEDQFWFIADFAAKRGFAVLMPSLPYHHRRAKGIQLTSGQKFVVALPQTVRDNFRRAVIDMRRGLDWLADRDNVDPHRIYITGASLGGMVSMLAYKADPRFAGAVFLVSGGGFAGILAQSDTSVVRNFRLITRLGVADMDEVAKVLTMVDPAALPDLWPRPVLMLNATDDAIFPVDEVKRAASTFHSPEIVWAKSSHYFPVGGAQYLMADFWASLAGTTLAIRMPDGATCRETVLPPVPGDRRLWVDLCLDERTGAADADTDVGLDADMDADADADTDSDTSTVAVTGTDAGAAGSEGKPTADAGTRSGSAAADQGQWPAAGLVSRPAFSRSGWALSGWGGGERSATFGIHLVNRVTPAVVVPRALWQTEAFRSVLEDVPASIFVGADNTVGDLAFALSYIRVLGRSSGGVYVLQTDGVAFLAPLDVEVIWSRCSAAVSSGLAGADLSLVPGLDFERVDHRHLAAYFGERVRVSRLASIPTLPDDALLDIRWAAAPFGSN